MAVERVGKDLLIARVNINDAEACLPQHEAEAVSVGEPRHKLAACRHSDAAIATHSRALFLADHPNWEGRNAMRLIDRLPMLEYAAHHAPPCAETASLLDEVGTRVGEFWRLPNAPVDPQGA